MRKTDKAQLGIGSPRDDDCRAERRE